MITPLPPEYDRLQLYKSKMKWLHTPEGKEYFKQAVHECKTLKSLCEHLRIGFKPYPQWIAQQPELAVYIGEYRELKNRDKPLRNLPVLTEYERRPAYRLIYKLNRRTLACTGIIGATADDPDTIWGNSAVKHHFEPYRLNPDDYKADYLKVLQGKGLYTLSNLRAISYCRITANGTIVILKPPNRATST